MATRKGNPNIKNHAVKFTSEYQPSPQAKSEGLKRRFEYEKAKKDMWAEFITAITPDTGEKVNVPEQQLKRWQRLLLTNPKYDEKTKTIKGYTDAEKDELFFKIVDKILPKETKLSGDADNPIRTEQQIKLEDAELLAKVLGVKSKK